MRGFLQNAEAKVPAPPLIEWAARKMAFNCSALALPAAKPADAAPCQPTVRRFIKKCLIKIAYIHAHAVTSFG